VCGQSKFSWCGFFMPFAIHLALRKAIDAAKFNGDPPEWYQMSKENE